MTVIHLLLAVSAVALAGCATERDSAVFVTRTSLGLDVDSAPGSAALGYNRVEGYLGPRYDSGTIPAVAGSFHTDGGLFDRKVRQVYATGKAARNATAYDTLHPDEEAEHFVGDRKAMFFGTGTVIGINVGFGGTSAESFSFGFKRKEVSVIPVSTTVTSTVGEGGSTTLVVNSFPSVFARLDNSTDVNVAMKSDLGISQFFATGVAAQRLANNRDVQAEFRKEAKDPKMAYRDEEHRQSRLALNSLYCVSKVADAELSKVFDHAGALSLFKDPQAVPAMRAAGPQAARAAYTGQIGLLDPTQPDTTALMQLHQKFVCDLPGAKT